MNKMKLLFIMLSLGSVLVQNQVVAMAITPGSVAPYAAPNDLEVALSNIPAIKSNLGKVFSNLGDIVVSGSKAIAFRTARYVSDGLLQGTNELVTITKNYPVTSLAIATCAVLGVYNFVAPRGTALKIAGIVKDTSIACVNATQKATRCCVSVCVNAAAFVAKQVKSCFRNNDDKKA